MKNPFLNTDHYSFVNSYKRRQSKVLSLINSQTRQRVISSNNYQPKISSYYYPTKMDSAYQSPYQKYQNTFRKNQQEGAKLYGLDYLRYKPKVYQPKSQTRQAQENIKLLTQKTFQHVDTLIMKSKQMKPSLKMSKVTNKSSKNIKGKDLKESMKVIKKRRTSKDTEIERRKSSMLTSMLNLNFQYDEMDYEQSDYDEQDLTIIKDQFKKGTNKQVQVQIVKKSNFKKSNISGFYPPFKEIYGNEQNNIQLRQTIDYILSDREKQREKSEVQIKKNQRKSKKRMKSIKIKKMPSINHEIKKQIQNRPQCVMLRGKKFYKFQRKLKSIRF